MTAGISSIASSLYALEPQKTLYHYTSLDALLQIMPSGLLWATEIHYLNDSSELKHATARFLEAVRRLDTDSTQNKDILTQLTDWLSMRLADGYMLFVVCFTENGDLLSQWRGYTPHAKGASLGFSQSHLLECAKKQFFEFGKCIYDPKNQEEIAQLAIQAVIDAAQNLGPAPASKSHPTQSYYPSFQAAESDLLRIAALMKHDTFEAEREWRAISPVISDYVKTEIEYRSGRTALVPYQKFDIKSFQEDSIGIEHVILGPTPNINLSMDSLSRFMSRHDKSSKPRSLGMSRVPYRET